MRDIGRWMERREGGPSELSKPSKPRESDERGGEYVGRAQSESSKPSTLSESSKPNKPSKPSKLRTPTTTSMDEVKRHLRNPNRKQRKLNPPESARNPLGIR